MSDFIDRKELLKAMDTWDKFGYTHTGAFVRNPNTDDYVPYVHYEDMVKCVSNMPTADVVEVVRCKDCRYFIPNEPCVGGTYEACDILVGQDGCGMNVEEDFFCAYGERIDANP